MLKWWAVSSHVQFLEYTVMIAHYFAVSRTSDALLTLVVPGKSNGLTKPYVENIKFENLNFYDSFLVFFLLDSDRNELCSAFPADCAFPKYLDVFDKA